MPEYSGDAFEFYEPRAFTLWLSAKRRPAESLRAIGINVALLVGAFMLQWLLAQDSGPKHRSSFNSAILLSVLGAVSMNFLAHAHLLKRMFVTVSHSDIQIEQDTFFNFWLFDDLASYRFGIIRTFGIPTHVLVIAPKTGPEQWIGLPCHLDRPALQSFLQAHGVPAFSPSA